MSTFKDASDRQWLLEITINEVRRIKKILGLDLLDLDQGRALQQLAGDAVLLVDVLWLLCEEQANKLGLSDEQFGRGMRGEAIESATEALFEGLVDFFPPQRRILLNRVMDTAKTLGRKERELVETVLTGPALEQFVEKELDQLKQKLEAAIGGSSSTNSPASSESTPEVSPSVA